MEKCFEDYLKIVKELKELGAVEISLARDSLAVKFINNEKQIERELTSTVNDLTPTNQEEDDNETLYWSSGS
jgi:hypothetical protein